MKGDVKRDEAREESGENPGESGASAGPSEGFGQALVFRPITRFDSRCKDKENTKKGRSQREMQGGEGEWKERGNRKRERKREKIIWKNAVWCGPPVIDASVGRVARTSPQIKSGARASPPSSFYAQIC